MIHHLRSGNWGMEPFGLRLVCPACGMLANFEPVPSCKDVGFGNESDSRITFRMCPAPECRAMVMAKVNTRNGIVEDQYPRSLFQIDVSSIPETVAGCLLEAKTCFEHSCNRAAAIMLRRAVEELCDDKGVRGNTLRDRVSALNAMVVLPPQLIEAMQELRILGNDAAHVTARAYEDVGSEQVHAAFRLVREVVKAVYQLDSLIQELRSLKHEESKRVRDVE